MKNLILHTNAVIENVTVPKGVRLYVEDGATGVVIRNVTCWGDVGEPKRPVEKPKNPEPKD